MTSPVVFPPSSEVGPPAQDGPIGSIWSRGDGFYVMGVEGWQPVAFGVGLSLSALLRRVVEGWPMGREAYPLLPHPGDPVYPHTVLNFTAAHVCQHLSKQCGKLAGLFEPLAHGKTPPSSEEVARQVTYTIIDALRLLSLGGGTVEQMETILAEWEKEP